MWMTYSSLLSGQLTSMGNMLTPFSKWKLLVRECWNLICVYIDNFFFIKKTVVGVTKFNKSPEQCNDVFLIAKDHCATNPCLHGGTCIDTQGWFNCSCTDRYGGPRCEFSKCETHCFIKNYLTAHSLCMLLTWNVHICPR